MAGHDNAIESAARAAAVAPDSAEAALALKMARIRAGLEPMPEQGTYLVLDPLHLAGLRKTVARLAKVATRRGLVPLALYEAPEPTWQERTRRDGTTVAIKLREVTIVGDVPDTGEWSYVARLTHAVSGTVIQRSNGGATLPDSELESYRAREPRCDHCDARRARKDTYVVRNTRTGEVAQVGRTCLEAYLGGAPEAAIFAFDALAQLTQELQASQELNDDAGALQGAPLVAFVAHTIALGSNFHGGLAWSRACGCTSYTPTPDELLEARAIVDAARVALLPSLEAERASHAATAAGAAFTWPAGVPRLPERWHDLSVIVAEGFVPQELTGIAADILRWKREQDRAQLAAEMADPVRAASTLAGVLAAQGIEAGARELAEGRLSFAPEMLARLVLLTNGKAQAVRDAATALVSAATTLDTPEPVGDYLGRVGERGTWRMTVSRMIPYTNARGSGHVVVLQHRTGPVLRWAVVFGNNAQPMPDWLHEGATALFSGRVERQGASQWRAAETVLSDVVVDRLEGGA